ncbi:MAG TPA: TadE family protein [Candidatus Dormibacteraeota bacterium]|jgi:hypothetical protein
MARHHRGGQKGQSLIEFAMCLPLLTIIMIGAWSVGHAAYDAEIVQESTAEAGKVAAIDRLNQAKDDSYALSDPELLAWINAAAHTADPSIKPGAITCDHANDPAWDYKGGEFPHGMGASEHKGPVGLLQEIASGSIAGLSLKDINPSLGTMRVLYHYDMGLSTGGTIPISYRFYFTRYSYTWFPFSAGGSLTHASC